ncbi:endonuclease/exonuclease/phosphatase family protein [Aureimonas ureilytica]|uniref:endonuclease/exonuclease/phosphatase family protein n=1 Tax=Aureimonas ureilytica TaxID=401562 RepID=UPI000375EE09|nr:endonuclease/exonuclease/phosphatase family protein [Aureimonas ureilytica]
MSRIVWRMVRIALLAVSVLGLAATAIPLVPTDTWWIRFLDYPRLQVAIVMLALLVAVLVAPGRTGTTWLAAACSLVAIAWNAVLLGPYLAPMVAPWPTPEVEAGRCPADRRLRVLSVNVQMGNHQDRRLLEMVRRVDPDIAWFQETNAWWEAELAPLSDTMPHGVAETQDNYYGIHLFSRLPLEDVEVRYLTNSRNPSAFATATLPSGDKARLYAIHPRPPQVGQSTAERDGQMMAVALEAHDDTLPHVVMGDMNSVPWEEIAARLQHIGGFRDPRVGRGLFVTWNANRTLLKWPLDHVLPGPRWTLARLEVLPEFGSDHLPLLAELCLGPEPSERRTVTPAELAAARQTVERGQGKAVQRGASEPLGAEGPEGDD